MTDATVLVPLFPLLAVLANLVFGRKMSEKAVGTMASAAVELFATTCFNSKR